MLSLAVADEQYRSAAALAGFEDWQLAPVEDPEFQAMREKVDAVLAHALRVGLKELRRQRGFGPDDGIEGYTRGALEALRGQRPCRCDTCDSPIESPILRLSGEVLEVACSGCNGARV